MYRSDDIYASTHQFRPLRLQLARELRGLSKSELAGKTSKTPSAISQFELGKTKPDVETVFRLALALGVPPRFFARSAHSDVLISVEECHFRSLRSASQKERRQLLAIGTLLSDLLSTLEEYVSLPEVDFPDCRMTPETSLDIEKCADSVRKHWGLGFGPIVDMVRLVESKGVIICPLVQGSEKVDAFSYWHKKRPFIFLLLTKESASRARFDVAHETGHLVMHPDVLPGDPLLERQANKFASAFLLPRESFEAECPTRLDFGHFFELKNRWKVSVPALIRRAYDLGKISEASYRRGFVYLKQKFHGCTEPCEPEREWPTIIPKAFDIVLADHAVEEIAVKAGIPEPDLRQLLVLLRTGSVQASLL